MHPIICQRTDDHWTAHFAGSPETAFGGEWPADAIQRLVATVPGLNVESITADHDQSSDDRLVFVLGVCPECGGSGEYVGLNAVEKCVKRAVGAGTANERKVVVQFEFNSGVQCL